MKIEGNQKELDAMVEFHKGNRVEGLRLQEEFAAEFRKEYKDKDHCPCLKACRYHGNCKECVAIHRAHQEHVPNCMRPLINKKLKLMSELTEHTLANEIEAPHEILRKQASQIPVDISHILGNLITVIFDYQILRKPLKILSLQQVNFPLLFPLRYILPLAFMNLNMGKIKGKKIS